MTAAIDTAHIATLRAEALAEIVATATFLDAHAACGNALSAESCGRFARHLRAQAAVLADGTVVAMRRVR